MSINSTFRRGVQQEASYQESFTPTGLETFLTLGRDLMGQQLWPTLNFSLVASGTNNYVEVIPGALLSAGFYPFDVVDGRGAYYTLGHSETTGSEHKITVNAGEIPSLRVHEEERGGTSDIIRDILGVKVGVSEWTWDSLNGGILRQNLLCVGGPERDSQDTNKPAKQLSNAPTYPSGGNQTPFAFQGASAWLKWDLDGTPEAMQPGFVKVGWNNNLNPPAYVAGGSSGNGYLDCWPVAIDKRMPGYGYGQFKYSCKTRTVHNATINRLQKTMDVAFVVPETPSTYYRIELQNVLLTAPRMDHLIKGTDLAYMNVDFVFEQPEIYVKDGLTAATYYGE